MKGLANEMKGIKKNPARTKSLLTMALLRKFQSAGWFNIVKPGLRNSLIARTMSKLSQKPEVVNREWW